MIEYGVRVVSKMVYLGQLGGVSLGLFDFYRLYDLSESGVISVSKIKSHFEEHQGRLSTHSRGWIMHSRYAWPRLVCHPDNFIRSIEYISEVRKSRSVGERIGLEISISNRC